MSISFAPLTHRATLSRMTCPRCHLETLHRGFTCLHCNHDHSPPRRTGYFFGARLVLNRKPRKS